MLKKVLITDFDNTLFDWFGVWYESFNALLENVVSISGLRRELLISEVRKIHQEHGTSEYAFLLEELPSLLKLYGSREQIRTSMAEAIEAYRDARSKNLALYPTVMETLLELKNRGVYLVGYTESKHYYSAYRVKKLCLDGVLDTIFLPEDHALPSSHQKGKKEEIELLSTKVVTLPSHEIKPNPKVLKDILARIGAEKSECIYIGDSELKDISMAQDAGVDDVYAHYGNAHFEEGDSRYELLRKVSHWSEEDVVREKEIKTAKSGVKATRSVDSFEEILNLFSFAAFEK